MVVCQSLCVVDVHIPKEAESSVLSQFLPISPLNVEDNISFAVWAGWMTKFVLENEYINISVQKAGVPGFTGCLKDATMIWSAIQEARKELYIVWLDLANAYGSVPNNLIQKTMGFFHESKTLNWDTTTCSTCDSPPRIMSQVGNIWKHPPSYECFHGWHHLTCAKLQVSQFSPAKSGEAHQVGKDKVQGSKEEKRVTHQMVGWGWGWWGRGCLQEQPIISLGIPHCHWLRYTMERRYTKSCPMASKLLKIDVCLGNWMCGAFSLDFCHGFFGPCMYTPSLWLGWKLWNAW